MHDYLNQAGGAERVLAVLHNLFPDAPIYTTIVDRNALWPALRNADIRVSWMQRLPGILSHFRTYLPLYPSAVESFRLEGYDVVISSSSAFAKGVHVERGAVHICYCHNPMRFVWDYERYVEREDFGTIARAVLRPVISRLRSWDLRASRRPTLFLANSSVVANRIRCYYDRTSTIVFPPVDLARFTCSTEDDPYYLVVSRLVGYKRIDLPVRTFTESSLPLVIVGDGPDRHALERIAGPTVRFAGRLPDEEVARLYSRCKAVILPGEEDFGIVPLEANASGRPVIAYRAGGALDSVRHRETGLFFDEQTPEAVLHAVQACDRIRWDKGALRHHAEQFGESVFRERILAVIRSAIAEVRSADLPPAATATGGVGSADTPC